MSRKLIEIYNESVKTRKKYLNMTEVHNDSKMSVMDSITWITSTAIMTFEHMIDAFMTDIVKIFNNRINGTPQYYANAMLKWQYKDELRLNEDGTQFYYPSVNQTKRIISHVSYQEAFDSEGGSEILVLKVAKGDDNNLERLSDDELNAAQAYINKIKFVGTRCYVISRHGDVLVPKLTVFYDGAVSKEEIYQNIEKALANFVANLGFDSVLHVKQIYDTLLNVEHVTDVYADPHASEEQGVFLAQYDEDNVIHKKPLQKVDRKIYTSSGYVCESTKTGDQADIPTFREAIVLKLEQ